MRFPIVQHDWENRRQLSDFFVIDEKIHVKVGDVVEDTQRHERVHSRLELNEDVDINLSVMKLDFVDRVGTEVYESRSGFSASTAQLIRASQLKRHTAWQ